ncbi:MAG: hypothetical protein Ct9H300mP16_05320 [Pseudomonadota bacterium]|nr:MAG: hypothetical protein Ct9H300mP16_05320 [Pseudomonadota bacterium]
MAMADYLRNSAPPMKDRAVTGPVSFQQIPELAERGKQRIERFLEDIDDLIGAQRRLLPATIIQLPILTCSYWSNLPPWRKLGLPDGAENAKRWYDAVSARPSSKP